MKPSKSILDKSFRYVASGGTAVDATWRRFGWQPVTDKERRVRRFVPGGNSGPEPGSKLFEGSWQPATDARRPVRPRAQQQ
ncbi:MAG TPA: hypothetical protein VLW55_02050 [Burkholderiaceae bacterium]|nr:hypothetical protein [Burkholderiaceae bacterium]